jgi:hypothetical protein
VFLGVGVLALVLALAWPRAGQTMLARRVAAAQADVEAVRTAARSLEDRGRAWPAAAEPGVVPSGLAGHLPEGFSFRRGGYVLAWGRWEMVAGPPEELPKTLTVPPDSPLTLPPDSVARILPEVEQLGGVTVQARDARLLAALLDHYGPRRSFVRDGTWTLVLPKEGR